MPKETHPLHSGAEVCIHQVANEVKAEVDG